jgi:predicted membrane GTPase involved in stress response
MIKRGVISKGKAIRLQKKCNDEQNPRIKSGITTEGVEKDESEEEIIGMAEQILQNREP